MVDGQPHLEETLELFDKWVQKENLHICGISKKSDSINQSIDQSMDQSIDKKKAIFVTCGDWDLKVMLPGQCEYFKIQKPLYFNHWINVKKEFFKVTRRYPKGMVDMLATCAIEHKGRHHSGIDDVKNIAEIVKHLALNKACVFGAK